MWDELEGELGGGGGLVWDMSWRVSVEGGASTISLVFVYAE